MLISRNFPVAVPTAGRTLIGVAVPYGTASQVTDDGRRFYTERFERGVFARSIADRGAKLKLFAEHDARRWPIGRFTQLEERPDGLHVEALIAKTAAGDDALELIREGLVDGLSVGARVIRNRKDPDGTVVRVEAALMEISLVQHPAYDTARVLAVRSATPILTVDLARRRLSLALRK